MNDLERGYSAEIDRIDKPQWHTFLKEFDDATFYQTWSYGENFWGTKSLSHVILRYEGRVVSMAQLRVQGFTLLRTGVAYLNWGPLWRRKDEAENRAHLRNMLRALFNEYVLKRHFALRILPKIFNTPENEGIKKIFLEERYAYGSDSLRTFVVDLRPSLETIRQNLSRSWRNSLKFAEKQGLDISEAKDPEQFAIVAAVGMETKERKKFSGGDPEAALKAAIDLPQELRLKGLICSHNGEPVAALAWSNIGRISFPLLGGTGNKGLQYKASFLLFWRMVEHSKENGFAFCDTAGVHKKRNPGNYFFKKGLAGKDAQEMTYLGQFDAYKNYLFFILFKTAMALREKIINGARRVKAWLR